MAIHFDPARWEALRKNSDLWWEGKLNRPMVSVRVDAYEPDRPQPPAPRLSQQTALDLRWTPDQLIDRLDYELSKMEFLGDSFPHVNMDYFGPGVLAAFLGAEPDNSPGSIWFFPKEYRELKDLHFTYDPDNFWFNRIREMYRAGNRRWHGQVLMGMVDLGGILDVLAVFRGTQNLLMDLYDEPEEVKRLVRELHDLWMRYHREFCEIMEEGGCPGYCDWACVFSSCRSYTIQSDFSFMISTPMFREFVLEELEDCTRQLGHVMYHLDGPGELKHLDTVLGMDRLRAVQWVPGAGAPDQSQWPEVYRKIHAAGKQAQIWDGYDALRAVSEQTGCPSGIGLIDLEFCRPREELIYHRTKIKELNIFE